MQMINHKESVPSVGVIGLGCWGTALSQHLARKKISVTAWDRSVEVVSSVNSKHRHAKFLTEYVLAPELVATSDIKEALLAPIILIALSAAAWQSVLTPLKSIPDSTIIISATKGIEPSSKLMPLQFLEEKLGWKNPLVTLSGPSFAHEVLRGAPCGIVAASKNSEAAQVVATLFTSETMKVYPSDDPLGVEWGGILKNVIAIGAGVSDGLKLGDSARAGVITRGMAEMIRFATSQGAKLQTLAGLSGLGDLLMTATSDSSRNRLVGLKLGAGTPLNTALKEIGSTAEGVGTALIIRELCQKFNVEMPISVEVAKLVSGETTPDQTVRSLISRPIRPEWP